MGILSALLLLAPLTFDRGEWHPRWLDLDGDCQNTRQEVLISQSQEVMLTPNGCHVEVGRWKDPYSLKTLYLPSEIDVDHVVPLKHAWATGGWAWDEEKRERFANDERYLVATDRSLNRQKGSRGPTKWMPPAPEVKCWYVRKWLEAKLEYELLMSPAEAWWIFAESGCGITMEVAEATNP
jgi:hypothetical protein